MASIEEPIIFWHRRDLRLSDHLGLAKARQLTNRIVGVFCFDPSILTRDDISPSRVSYLLACLAELGKGYAQKGSQLLFFYGDPLQLIPDLASTLQARAVFWSEDVEPYARSRDTAMRIALAEKSIKYESFWDQLLHQPDKIFSQSQTPYTVYTPFWKNWSTHEKLSPAKNIESLIGLSQSELEKIETIALPTARDLGFANEYTSLLLGAGEKDCLERLEQFCTNSLQEYKEQRNFPSIEGTSMLSAALKFGTIGIRRVWQESQNIYAHSRSDEGRQNIITWHQELAWREFYQHCLYHFPELAIGPYRKEFKDFPWSDNQAHFQAWCKGNTGYPIVDAAMRQLNQTGWMHNRTRMIVASFLTKDLIINWQWGERYFMQKLIDGDMAANNGGWQWSASSGMDPKPLRIFNPYTQAQRYDPEGDYIRQWLPELASLDTVQLLSGKISSLERVYCNYPEPIVDHNEQQRKFKNHYQQQKNN